MGKSQRDGKVVSARADELRDVFMVIYELLVMNAPAHGLTPDEMVRAWCQGLVEICHDKQAGEVATRLRGHPAPRPDVAA